MDNYEYELRRGDVVIATGHIQLETPPAPGDTLSLGRTRAHVAQILRLGRTPRLILEARSS